MAHTASKDEIKRMAKELTDGTYEDRLKTISEIDEAVTNIFTSLEQMNEEMQQLSMLAATGWAIVLRYGIKQGREKETESFILKMVAGTIAEGGDAFLELARTLDSMAALNAQMMGPERPEFMN